MRWWFLLVAVVLLSPLWPATLHPASLHHETIPIFESRTGKVVLMETVRKSDEEWKRQLTPEQ